MSSLTVERETTTTESSNNLEGSEGKSIEDITFTDPSEINEQKRSNLSQNLESTIIIMIVFIVICNLLVENLRNDNRTLWKRWENMPCIELLNETNYIESVLDVRGRIISLSVKDLYLAYLIESRCYGYYMGETIDGFTSIVTILEKEVWEYLLKKAKKLKDSEYYIWVYDTSWNSSRTDKELIKARQIHTYLQKAGNKVGSTISWTQLTIGNIITYKIRTKNIQDTTN